MDSPELILEMVRLGFNPFIPEDRELYFKSTFYPDVIPDEPVGLNALSKAEAEALCQRIREIEKMDLPSEAMSQLIEDTLMEALPECTVKATSPRRQQMVEKLIKAPPLITDVIDFKNKKIKVNRPQTNVSDEESQRKLNSSWKDED